MVRRRQRNFVVRRWLNGSRLLLLLWLLLLRRDCSRLLLLRHPARLPLSRRQTRQCLGLLLRHRFSRRWFVSQWRSGLLLLLLHARRRRKRCRLNAGAGPLIRRQRHRRRQWLIRREIAIEILRTITAGREIRRRRGATARNIRRRPRRTENRAELRMRRCEQRGGGNQQHHNCRKGSRHQTAFISAAPTSRRFSRLT